MYICYLDESGNIETAGTTAYFVLLGLAIPATTWRAKDAEIAAILDAHQLFGEVHTAWMARRYPEQERIAGFAAMSSADRERAVEQERRADLAKASLRGPKAVQLLAKNYRKTRKYIHLTHAERVSILRDIADRIGGWQDAVIFADAQRKAALLKGVDPVRVLDFAFEQVVTRFHTYLDRTNVPVGLLVQDQNQTTALRLTRLARNYHAKGTRYSTVSRLVETPLFVDSSLTSMVQLADLCAYAVRRFFENGEEDLLNRIYPRFDTLHGKLVGLRHYTGKQRCNCRVCVDHGRV